MAIPQYHVIGFLCTSGSFYISKHKATAATPFPTTRHKARAWKMTREAAGDMVERFHRVQALGHHHQGVLHYDVRKA